MKFIKFAFLSIVSMALLAVTACSGQTESSQPQNQKLVVVSWGGAGTDAQREAWYKPFTEKTGIEIVEVTNPSTAKLIAQVDSGAVEWDVVLMDKAQIGSVLQKGDYLEKIPYDQFDKNLLSQLSDDVKGEYSVGSYYWGWALTYRTDVFKEKPKDWKDFWDLEKFPGQRTLPNRPWANLEASMMALGKDKQNVYPIDFNAGFDKIKEITPHVTKFWDAGAEGIQLLADKEAVMGLVFTVQAISKKNQGVPVDVVWDNGIYSMDNWVIPKGKMSENALKFIQFVSQAQQQADITNYVPYGPINKDSFGLIDDEKEKDLITYPDNISKMIRYDSEWWAPQRDQLTEQWNEWKLNLKK